MHKLLDEQNIIDNRSATDESILLRIDQTRHNQLQSSDQDLGTYLIEDVVKADRFEISREGNIRMLWDESNQSLLLLLQNFSGIEG